MKLLKKKNTDWYVMNCGFARSLELFKELKLQGDFAASRWWFCRFLKRNKELSMKNVSTTKKMTPTKYCDYFPKWIPSFLLFVYFFNQTNKIKFYRWEAVSGRIDIIITIEKRWNNNMEYWRSSNNIGSEKTSKTMWIKRCWNGSINFSSTDKKC